MLFCAAGDGDGVGVGLAVVVAPRPGIAQGVPVAIQHVVVIGHIDGVGAIGQVGEGVIAAAVGRGRADDIAAAVAQHHGDALRSARIR